MSKLVFDTDALIKLARAGILGRIPHKCVISQAVFEEAVVEGKKHLYDGAFAIERHVEDGTIQVNQTMRIDSIPGLGKGELSTFALFKQAKANAIISDDKRFLAVLEEYNISFIVPTDVIVALAHKIGKKEALEALKRIKPFVSTENYESALDALGGKK